MAGDVWQLGNKVAGQRIAGALIDFLRMGSLCIFLIWEKGRIPIGEAGTVFCTRGLGSVLKLAWESIPFVSVSLLRLPLKPSQYLAR